MNEYAVDKSRMTILVYTETLAKVVQKYGDPKKKDKPGSKGDAVVKALEESVKDVKLPKSVLEKVREETAEKYRKRMAERDRLYGNRQKAPHGFGKRRLAAEAKAKAAGKSSK